MITNIGELKQAIANIPDDYQICLTDGKIDENGGVFELERLVVCVNDSGVIFIVKGLHE